MKKKSYGYKQGNFKPVNPDKLLSKNPYYRSSFELHFMRFCDNNPAILNWSNEDICIKYLKPVDKKCHRYFMDFRIVTLNSNNEKVTTLIEIKPYEQTKKPIRGRKSEKNFLKECITYSTNISKWQFASEFCKKRGWKFKIITENELFLNKL